MRPLGEESSHILLNLSDAAFNGGDGADARSDLAQKHVQCHRSEKSNLGRACVLGSHWI
jgi:hypothetical protein